MVASFDKYKRIKAHGSGNIALAMAGLIDSKYINESEALYAAKYILVNTSFCIKANYAITGTFVLEPRGLYVLLLNGALDYLKNGNDMIGGENCNGCFS